MPAAPWSVPAEPFSLRAAAELRPDVNEHAVGDAAPLEVALEREQAVGRQLEAVGEGLRLVGVRVVGAGRLQRDAPDREAGVEHLGEQRQRLPAATGSPPLAGSPIFRPSSCRFSCHDCSMTRPALRSPESLARGVRGAEVLERVERSRRPPARPAPPSCQR